MNGIEHKAHLQNIVAEQTKLSQEISQLNSLLISKREVFTKYQGIVEYLTANGVTLEEEESEAAATEVVTESQED
jgi:hypothetical protein|tara:strand:+ start:192 stop:416 length:225 start_codon:yes stop_codon:yes gene_type:complete